MKQWLRVAPVAMSAIILASCASTGTSQSSKRRVVTVNTPAPVQADTVSYDAPEAMMACDTKAMRRAALDGNLNNDVASVTVEREVRPGVRTLTDLDINCREYFAAKLGGRTQEPTLINAAATNAPQPDVRTEYVYPDAVAHPTEPVRVDAMPPAIQSPMQIEARAPMAEPRYYRVRSGDTLYSIGRKHCTAWQNIASENGIRNERRIEPGDVLRLPVGSC